MKYYNAVAEIDGPVTDDTTDEIIDALDAYSVAVATSELGHHELTITLPGDTARQAITTALAVVDSLITNRIPDTTLRSMRVLPTSDYDILTDRIAGEPTLSVADVAAMGNLSRQAVQKAITTGRLPAGKFNGRWVVSEGAAVKFLDLRPRNPDTGEIVHEVDLSHDRSM